MASHHEPLLDPTKGKPHNTACKIILLTLFLAAVICSTALLALQVTTYAPPHPLQPSVLCASSPTPASCRAIVSGVLAEGNSQRQATTHVLRAMLRRSLQQLRAAVMVTGGIQSRVNGPRQQAALADCRHLMDLSRDHLAESDAALAASSPGDARTWLSAALTNYDTCLDGLGGAVREELEGPLKPLMELASASLAVLGTLDTASDDHLTKPVLTFPSWVNTRDRKMMEGRTPAVLQDIQADVVVAQDGSGKYNTVQAAVDAAPNKTTSRYVIYVKKGLYTETVRLSKKKTNIMIAGDGMDATIITGSLNVVDGSTTFNSATLAADGGGFMLQDICIQNTAGAVKHQAVALRVGSDQAIINRCKIEAYQDTLYAYSLRQFYRDSTISGTVDYIFGNAAVVFQNCSLVARLPMSNQQNLVTAQGRTDPNQNTGTSVQNCQVVPSADLQPVEGTIQTYLGRPWKAYSRTVFLQSYLDQHINAEGWQEWNGSVGLDTLYYGEYANSGPGSGTSGRVNWTGYHVITDANVAKAFTVAELIQGGAWLQDTGVEYSEGL